MNELGDPLYARTRPYNDNTLYWECKASSE